MAAIVVALVLVLTEHAWAPIDTETMLQMIEQQRRMKEQADRALTRPTRNERAAIKELLKQKPEVLEAADRNFLVELQKKVVWSGLEHRTMHEIWTEVTGKPWETEEQQAEQR